MKLLERFNLIRIFVFIVSCMNPNASGSYISIYNYLDFILKVYVVKVSTRKYSLKYE